MFGGSPAARFRASSWKRVIISGPFAVSTTSGPCAWMSRGVGPSSCDSPSRLTCTFQLAAGS